jgi:hypothetical protein
MQSLPTSGGPTAMPTSGYGQPTTALPLLALDTDSQDAAGFDYSAFLLGQQEDIDIDYLAEESSASASTATLTEGSVPQSLAPQHRPQRQLSPSRPSGPLTTRSRGNAARSESSTSPGPPAAQPKQRLERRGHTKSRRGCFNCKRRRIKVSFTLPPNKL